MLVNEFHANTDWPIASAVAIALLVLLLMPMMVYQGKEAERRQAMQHGRSRFLTVLLWLGMAFLYIPPILLIVYSFNYSKLVPVWGGWSLRWCVVLFQSAEVWTAVWLSLRIAVVNATAATLLGTLVGLAMIGSAGSAAARSSAAC